LITREVVKMEKKGDHIQVSEKTIKENTMTIPAIIKFR